MRMSVGKDQKLRSTNNTALGVFNAQYISRMNSPGNVRPKTAENASNMRALIKKARGRIVQPSISTNMHTHTMKQDLGMTNSVMITGQEISGGGIIRGIDNIEGSAPGFHHSAAFFSTGQQQ